MKLKDFVLLVTAIFISALSSCNTSTSVGLVDVNYLFDNFKYTYESKKELQEWTNRETLFLDSIRSELVLLQEKLKNHSDTDLENIFKSKRDQFNQLSETYEHSKSDKTKDLDQKILKQLDQYLSEFAKYKKCDLLLGKNDQDVSILYASKALNLTEEALRFINDRYESNGQ